MIKFCSITTLPPRWRSHILDEMSWDNGGMSLTIRYNLPKCRLALNLERQRLVCWAMVDFLDYEGNGCPAVGSWTAEKRRRKGYASKTIGALLDHSGIPTAGGVNVYRYSMRRIVKSLGYTPIYHGWDKGKLSAWLKKNGRRVRPTQ